VSVTSASTVRAPTPKIAVLLETVLLDRELVENELLVDTEEEVSDETLDGVPVIELAVETELTVELRLEMLDGVLLDALDTEDGLEALETPAPGISSAPMSHTSPAASRS
jgi:hypothetical protein